MAIIKGELEEACVERLAANPANMVGRVYMINSLTSRLMINNGSSDDHVINTANLNADNFDKTYLASNYELRLKDSGVQHVKMGTRTGTDATAAVGEVGVSTQITTFTTTTGENDITNLTLTLVTIGRPVLVFLKGVATGAANGYVYAERGAGNNDYGAKIRFYRDAVQINTDTLKAESATASNKIYAPGSAFMTLDVVAAGTYTYKATIENLHTGAGNDTAGVDYLQLIAMEL